MCKSNYIIEDLKELLKDSQDKIVKLSNEKSNAYELLKRLRDWDSMDSQADGIYWKKEIDKILNS